MGQAATADLLHPGPSCALQCNEGCVRTPQGLRLQTRRPSLVPTRSPTRQMWSIVGDSASARLFRPLPAHPADLTFPMPRPQRPFGPTRFALCDQQLANRWSFVAPQTNAFR